MFSILKFIKIISLRDVQFEFQKLITKSFPIRMFNDVNLQLMYFILIN